MRTRLPDPADSWTDDDARVALDEWRRSGESIAAFARKHGVAAPRLYWWKKKLRAPMAASSARSKPTTPMLSLVPASILLAGAALTIRLPGEVSIEVANASPSWVAAIVAELTRPLS
jgi:transposase-like protein